jgi:two-component system sensor histidine kinase/response regulator
MTARLTMGSNRSTVRAVTIVFVILALSLEAVMGFYWFGALQPRLEQEAASQAQILARSQSNVIGHALLSGSGAERVRTIVATLDELLLLRDPESNTPFFQSIELQVDYDVVKADVGTLDFRRGRAAESGIRTEVAVYDPKTAELVAIAWFRVSDRFFQQLSSGLKREILFVSLSLLAVLFAVWLALVFVLRTLEKQTAKRLRAESELWAQEQKYERLVNALSAYFVYSRGADGALTFVSNSVTNVLGLTPPEFIGRTGDAFGTVEAGSAERTFELELTHADGDVHRIELSEVRVIDESGRVTGFEGIARDVTADRLLQDELRHSKEQAESANRAKSQFLANMSHEIRTPLNAIVGMTALALKSDITPKLRDYLDKIRGSARLLAEIIEDILDLSRIEAGRLEIQRTDFDLDDLLADLSDVVGLRVAQKDIEILFSAAADVPRRLRGDPVRLKQVLLNLLNNALKFTERGEIVVDIAVVDGRRDHVELKFSVRDTGVGIPSEHLPSLFEPFTQVDTSNTRRFGGAGLGLAISRRLVEMMGGGIAVDSVEGKGTTFSFTAAFDLPRGASGPRRLADEFRGLPVLVADDNGNARLVLGSMLRSLSCKVTTVASGEEALTEAAKARSEGHPYRLAILDWKMPGLDGAETALKLAKIDGDSLPVILVTAYDREEALRQAERAGIDVVLHKPVSPSTLHDAVLRVLEPGHPDPRGSESEIRFAPGQRLLLAEDNAINREVARELLALAGLAVKEAHNGIEALRLLEEESFDGVLMDVQMPELDGIETVREIRRRPKLAALPVVAMTAHAMLGDRERFIEAGMSDYVAKPIEERELLRVLSRWLQPADSAAPARSAAAAAPRTLPVALPGLAIAEGLRRASGNENLYRRLLADFDGDAASSVTQLDELLRRGATAEALDILHTIKGSAATIGADSLARAAARLEVTLKNGGSESPTLDEISSALHELRGSLARLPIRKSEPVRRAEPAAEQQDVQPLIVQLRHYLEQNNLSAMESFENLRRVVGSEAQSVNRIEAALDRLDFGAAALHLDSLQTELNGR